VSTRSLLLRIFTANLAGGLIVFVFFTFVVPIPADLHSSQATIDIHHRLAALFFVAIMLLFLPIAIVQFRAAEGPVPDWIRRGGPPDEGVRRAVLAQPLRQAGWLLGDWLASGFLYAAFNLLVLGDGIGTMLRVFGGILIGGLATSGVTYLAVERQLRPLFALVLEGGEPVATAGRIRTRLLLSWALGSGLALAAIAVGPLGMPSSLRARLLAPAVFLAVIGLIGGGLLVAAAARSVTDRLDDVRHALAAVRDGNLDASVDVDDGGEVGLLQAGFNHMVGGLRERQELADLFGRHVGAEVARQALERGRTLGGEQRQLSALFVDLIGSTALAERLPASEVVAILNAMFEAVVRTVTAEGGWVNKFEGDGALCVFGAPADQPDHAARALRAARSMHEALAARPVDAAIAVSSGAAVAGNVGSVQRFEYTVIGDPVNESARLTEQAKLQPGRVLASEAAVVAAGGEAGVWVLAATLELRGRANPTRAYRPG
jgi:adenylate cyclase